ncbi:MAG: hypothetical protein AAB089_00295, partial [Nitrospirota bacterium]
MTKNQKEDKLKARIQAISYFYQKNGRMPSFSEAGQILGLRSKNAVFKLIKKLEKLGLLKKDQKGRLIPGSIAHS